MKSSKAVLSIVLAALCATSLPAFAQDAAPTPPAGPAADSAAKMSPEDPRAETRERFRLRFHADRGERGERGARPETHHRRGMMMSRMDGKSAPEMRRQMREHFAARMGERGRPGRQMHRGEARMGGALLDFVCSERNAERLEIGLVRLSYRLDLTDAQRADFDALRDTALSAQSDFAATCTAAREAEATDPISRLRSRLDIDNARVAAIEAVLPVLETFYDGLEDAQKANLEPRSGRAAARPAAPAAPATPATPDAPATPADGPAV